MAGTVIKKIYESTVEEAVDANYRLVEIAGVAARQMWIGIAVMVAIPFLMFGLLLSSPLVLRLVFAAFVSLLGIGIYLVLFKRALRRNLRRMVVKFRGGNRPVTTEFELNDSGLVFRQLGQELKFDWSNVKELNEIENTIEIVMEPLGIAAIPKRVFDSRVEIEEWVLFVQERMGDGKPNPMRQED